MITLFCQYYIPVNADRRKEIDICFKQNIENKAIDKIIMYFEKESDMKLIPDNKKIIKRFYPDRMSYGFWLKETDKLPVGTVSLLVNADIYLNETIRHFAEHAEKMRREKRFIALTRYNPDGAGGLKLNNNPHWTQDTWGVVKDLNPMPHALYQETAFELGQPGCDNKIAYVMHSYGYTVTNPCEVVESIHLQADEGRAYDSKASKLIGLHAFVHPTKTVLEDAKLDLELLTRSPYNLFDINVNNWINGRNSYRIKADEAFQKKDAERVEAWLKEKALQPEPPASVPVVATPTAIPIIEAVPAYITAASFKVADYKLVKEFSSRYKVYSKGAHYYFHDRYWPVVKVRTFEQVNRLCASSEARLFCYGFLQSNILDGAVSIDSDFEHDKDYLFWQHPCKTEGDAANIHLQLPEIYINGNEAHVYVALPWATIIDKKAKPHAHTGLVGSRIRTSREILKKFSLELRVHTVCQHIHWRDIAHDYKASNITDLWISHKEIGLEELEGIKLHPWTLYAVNYREIERRIGFVNKPIHDRSVFASFEGAYMKHYISTVREDLKQLQDLQGYHIVLKDLWHFNKVVYNYQVYNDEKHRNSIATDEVVTYNELMSNSVFSLCPSGAGPNSLRLWECLANGSIPVLLSDKLELPDIEHLCPELKLNWKDVIVFHVESKISDLDQVLKAIDKPRLERMQKNGSLIYKKLEALSCFGTVEKDEQVKIASIRLFKDQQIHIPGKTVAKFTGEEVLKEAEIVFDSDVDHVIIWFDQAQKISAINVHGANSTEDQIKLEGIRKFGKFFDLRHQTTHQIDGACKFVFDTNETPYSMGLKLSLPKGSKQSLKLKVDFEVVEIAYAIEAARLDEAGYLLAGSNTNEIRKDNLFDSEFVDSGEILSSIKTVVKPAELKKEKLFPTLPPRTKNLAGEEIGNGITMYVHLMNRNENVVKNLKNWLTQGFDELILLDWSSKEPVSEIPGVLDDKRVRVVRVEGQKTFIRTLAQNLASQMARNSRVFKCDSDVEFKGDFFSAHSLSEGEFWVGDWHQARDFNERHLHGETYYHLNDFFRVNGYDERISAYGQDDTNLKDRMCLSGLIKKVFSYNYLFHQPHEQTKRIENQNIIHPMIRMYQNRLFTNESVAWSKYHDNFKYSILSKNNKCVLLVASSFSEKIYDVKCYEDTAINLVASWYAAKDELKKMSKDQKINLIWKKQVE